jgi:predicted ester cyclase
MLNMAPTGRRFVLKGMVFWRIHDGRIAERWATLDRMGLVQQLTATA